MDYTISKNAILFDDLLRVLNMHQNEPGVIEALLDLKAAKTNYDQRSIDHMVGCLVLAIHDLIAHPPSPALQTALKSVIHQFYTERLQAGARLENLARAYEEGGGKLLSHEEILADIDERRGASR